MSLALLSLVFLAVNAPADTTAGGAPAAPPVEIKSSAPIGSSAPGDTGKAAPKIKIRAVRASGPITIDGTINDAPWQAAQVVSEFVQRDPVENGRPSQRTEVRVLYDDDALYVAARMHDTSPDSILAPLSRRDVSLPGDRFTLYLDPYLDQRSGYYFAVNAAGTLIDGTLQNDDWDDNSWDGVWEAEAKIDGQGWTAELRVPYSQLRFRKTEPMVWGINFGRGIQRHNELNYVAIRRKNASGFVSRFPHLVGLESITPRRSIELLPYVTQKGEFLRHSTGDPFNDGSRFKPDAGADLRMSVGSSLTLNATVNPDFGQVEVDPAVVNLSDVESFFQEKRPFFVEGSSNFNFGNQGASDYWGFNWPEPIFFYSRRVGRAPQGSAPDADYTNVPFGTTILGAAKLTGKLGKSWNFGTLHALTAKEEAKLQMGGFEDEAEVEPMTYYGVARGLREFKDRQRGLGLMGTFANRKFTSAALEDQLNSRSLMAGFDGWTFLDKSQTWVISGWSAMSHVAGTTDRITALQQNSRHYFQRPDAGHVSVDTDATSLTGFGSRYWLNKQKGRSFVNAAAGFMDPKFDVADIGFQTRADVINTHVGAGYKWTDATKWRKYQNVLGAVASGWDFDGNHTYKVGYLSGTTEFYNNYSWEYSVAVNPKMLNNRLTRGGPLMETMPGYEAFTYFDTDGKSKLFYFVSAYTYTRPEAGSWEWNVFPGVEWKPMSNLTMRVGPGYERINEVAQFVGRVDDPTATETFGSRYVFANLDQRTFSANIRFNCSFTPRLSLELFAQPLISAGKYTDYKSLARSKSFSFDRYAAGASPLEAGDFNFKSLRGNAVLRWEYMPGSAFFLVWTQERSEEEDTGDFRLGDNTRRLLKAAPNNIILAKASYYFNL